MLPALCPPTHWYGLPLQVDALCKERGVSLPADMLEIAAKYGLRLSAFEAFAALQVWDTKSNQEAEGCV